MTNWRYIEDDGVAAAQGLAGDELLLENAAAPGKSAATLRLYTYKDHCALVGRFQNLHAELNLPFCTTHGIEYSRRLTGGGAILMGSRQLGLCLALRPPEGLNTRQLYRLFARPLIHTLKGFGVQAGFRGKNDLEVRGRKIAGMGIYVHPQGAVQFHTSLLLDLDVGLMLKTLNIPLQKAADKQLQRIHQRITTLRQEAGSPINLDDFRHRLKRAFESHFGIRLQPQPFGPAEQTAIQQLVQRKYAHPDWLFLQTPQPDMQGMGLKKTPLGLLRAYVALKGQTIKSLLITGDFLEHESLFKNIESRLKWSPAERDALERAVQEAFADYPAPLPELQPEEVVSLIWRAALAAMKEVHFHYRGGCYQGLGAEVE